MAILTQNPIISKAKPYNCPIQPNLDDHSQRGGAGNGPNATANKVRRTEVAPGMFVLRLRPLLANRFNRDKR